MSIGDDPGGIGNWTCHASSGTVRGPSNVTISSPTVTTASVSSITHNSASGGGEITATGGENATARGVCWDVYTNPDPDTSDSKSEETGSFGTGAFTASLTSLSSQTHYKVRAYATNSAGTGYGSVVDFWTLSDEPTAHAASFSASTASASQIDLSFSAASTITNADGYIILQKTGSAPTGTPADATGYSVGNTIGDATVATLITNTSSTSASITTGISAGNRYYFTLIPYGYDGSNPETYNYKTDGTIPEANASTSTITVTKTGDYGGGSTTPGTPNVRFLQLGVQTDTGTAYVTSGKAKFTSASTAVNADISAFDVYYDANGNGEIDGGDTLLGTVPNPDLINGATVTVPSPLPATTEPTYLLLVLDIAGSANPSHTVGLELTDSTFITSDGIVSSANFPIKNDSDTSLPVELSSFTATASDGQVTLRWVTQSEVNNVGFSVYRSEEKDGNYTKIAFVCGAGNSAMPRDYQFVDKNAEAGKTYFYYLEDVDIAGERNKNKTIKVVVPPAKFIPKEFRLLQNYPNPFNPETWIPFDLAADANVTIRIYDVKGQLVRQLDLINQKAGSYLDKNNAAYWDGKDQLGQSVSSGIYFYTLKAGDFVATRRMVILK
jgi:hypothetical protein